MTPNDVNFAYKIRHALNERADALPEATVQRLALAREAALARKKPSGPSKSLVMQWGVAGTSITAGSLLSQPFSWLGRFGVVAPLVLGVAIFLGMYHTAQQQRIDELAEMDIAVLSDELTLLAYLDTGFNAYLAKRAE